MTITMSQSIINTMILNIKQVLFFT